MHICRTLVCGMIMTLGSVGACTERARQSPRTADSRASRASQASHASRKTATTPATPIRPRPLAHGARRAFGEPCLGRRSPAAQGALKAQRVIHVDRRSPRWLPLARRHIAGSPGCAGCARMGRAWKPRTVGFHAHLGADGRLRVEGKPAAVATLTPAVQSCFDMLDSEGMQVLLTVAPNQRRSATLTAVLMRLLIPGVSVHLYAR